MRLYLIKRYTYRMGVKPTSNFNLMHENNQLNIIARKDGSEYKTLIYSKIDDTMYIRLIRENLELPSYPHYSVSYKIKSDCQELTRIKHGDEDHIITKKYNNMETSKYLLNKISEFHNDLGNTDVKWMYNECNEVVSKPKKEESKNNVIKKNKEYVVLTKHDNVNYGKINLYFNNKEYVSTKKKTV